MTDEQRIPLNFWRVISLKEFERLVFEQDGWLNAEQCARLWRMEDRQGEPPQRLQVLLDRKQVEKLAKEVSKLAKLREKK